jgi:hypothetical protein
LASPRTDIVLRLRYEFVRLTIGAHPRRLRRATDADDVECSALLGSFRTISQRENPQQQ